MLPCTADELEAEDAGLKLIPKSVMQAASGLLPLVALLSAPADSEAAEFATAAIGNLAAGGQALKDALRQVRSSPFCSKVLTEIAWA